VEPPGGDAYYSNDTTQESSWTNPDDGAAGADGGADGGVAIVQLASAATEAELLHAFDAILAAASTPAAVAFSAVTSLSLRRKKEVGGAVWTERVAAAYGGMLRELKRVEAAAPSSAPPPLAPAGVGRALFTRAVSTDNADDVAGGTGGENKDEDSTAQPGKTLPRPVYKGDSRKLINLCGSEGSGNVDEARDLIARGINVDELDSFGQTALIQAVRFNHLPRPSTASMIFLGGGEYELSCNRSCAATFNRFEIVRELIRAGAALDVRDKQGKTALMYAAECNHLGDVLQRLDAATTMAVGDAAADANQRRCKIESVGIAAMLVEAGARCPGYKRSGVFNSKCKFCRESKKGHNQ
jgi:hypothetical protein